MSRQWVWMFVLIAGCANAQSALVGKRLIARGDPVERVRDAGGAPDRVDRIDGADDAPPMEIWTYRRRDRTITLWVVDERVVQVSDQAASMR